MRFIQTQGSSPEYVNVESITTLQVTESSPSLFVIRGNGTYAFGEYATADGANAALAALVAQFGVVSVAPSDV